MQEKNPLLLETIKIEDGKVHNIQYHQKRCDKSRKVLFGALDTLELATHIKVPKRGLYRCRILYDVEIRSIEYIPYLEKNIQSLKIVTSNLEYTYKYANRDKFQSLLEANSNADDILIEKDGFLTDTSMANIAFYDESKWFTPKKPLLEGTMRTKLLDKGFLIPKDIKTTEVFKYKKVALINAMIGFKILESLKIHDLQGNTYDY